MERNPGNAAWRGSRRRCQDLEGDFPKSPAPIGRSVSPRDLSEPTKTIRRFGTANRVALAGSPTGIPLSRKVGRLSGRDFVIPVQESERNRS